MNPLGKRVDGLDQFVDLCELVTECLDNHRLDISGLGNNTLGISNRGKRVLFVVFLNLDGRNTVRPVAEHSARLLNRAQLGIMRRTVVVQRAESLPGGRLDDTRTGTPIRRLVTFEVAVR